MTVTQSIGILCVDDNAMIGEAVERWIRRDPSLRWDGWLPDDRGVVDAIRSKGPAVVLLDMEIPGTDTCALVRRISGEFPDVRVLMLSGHIRREYIVSAIDAGALGYVGKHRPPEYIADAIHRIARGEFYLCDEAALAAGFG